MHALMQRMYPLCRSITGDGLRATLEILGESLPLERHSVATGTRAHDWTINDEWTVRDAYIADMGGRRVVDFREHNLHLVGYSMPVHATMTLEQLRPHLHTLPTQPEWIPFRTSYYAESWGFCLPHEQLESMDEGPYEVVVDSTLSPGMMDYAELVIPGESRDEVMFTAHVCHPSMANDNLAGIAVASEVAKTLRSLPRRHFTYRFLFAPGTIGSISWLSRNASILEHIQHGLVLTGLGGPGPLVYKQTRTGSRTIDKVTSHVISRRGGDIRTYSPYGYDERQFNAIGFDLPFGRLSRTPHGEYPEYHTSADNLDYVKPSELADSYVAVLEIVDALENNLRYRNLSPHGEPQLGKRGLYPPMGGPAATDAVMAMLWVLAYADGTSTLIDIARRSDADFAVVRSAAHNLIDAGLLEQVQ
jgi:aminopeptidase-like protein